MMTTEEGEGLGQQRLGEGQNRAGDYTALIINDQDHSQALESLPEDCLPLRSVKQVR